MNIIVFGATGSIGQELVKQALAEGHCVTTFVRTPAKLQRSHKNLRLAQGDVLDYAAVKQAVNSQEAVLCALGAGSKGGVRAQGTKYITRAMDETGVRRLICLTTLGVGDSSQSLSFFWRYVMFGLLLRQAFADHIHQEEIIRKSQLDWTIVRPAAFTDGAMTGRYQHGFPPTTKGLKLKISRADVAHFILRQLNESRYLHQTPGLSY
jgi:putative NADH-flavin reductase